MHEVLVNGLGGLSLPRKGVVRLTDHPDMTLDVYRGRKTTMQQNHTLFGAVYHLAFAQAGLSICSLHRLRLPFSYSSFIKSQTVLPKMIK